jgi:hypothetical protein
MPQPRLRLLFGGVVLATLASLLTERSPSAPAADHASSASPARSSETVVRPQRHVASEGVSAEADVAAVYRPRELLLAPRPGADLHAIADDYGAEVIREAGLSGYGLLRLAEGGSSDALLDDPRVYSASGNARVSGADSHSPTDTGGDGGIRGLQWHLGALGVPAEADLSGVVVAVLDTGVAYRSGRFKGRRHVQAPSLSGVSIVAPRDFVDNDRHALDEHQHGTHIATLIVGSGEDVSGVAPGASLMPLRVLDEDNAGSEHDLIEAISWAVARGADVINMSLTFPANYVPSSALQQVLRDAADAGVVMVAASGNDGRDDVPCWPAASPLVIGVGAFTQHSGKDGVVATDYSNLGVGIDLMAPGGDLTDDIDGDGYADGMIGESITLNRPGEVGVWMFAGTSQAAATVSGAAAWLVAAGGTGEQVREALLSGAQTWGNNSFMHGHGVGSVNITGALEVLEAGAEAPEYHAGLLGWPGREVEEDGTELLYGTAEVTIILSDGSFPAEQLEVYGTAWGPEGAEQVSCNITGSNHSCTLETSSSPRLVDGAEQPLSWAIQVEAVIERNVEKPRRPGGAVFGSDGLEILLAAIDDKPSLKHAAVALSWEDDGEVAAGFSVTNGGAGVHSSPMSLIFTPGAMPTGSSRGEDLDLDGTGLSSSPLGLMRVQHMSIFGKGLSGSPLRFSSQDLVVLSGTGLISSPLGLSPQDIYSGGGGGIDADLGLGGSRMLLSSGSLVGASTDASAEHIDGVLAAGGWMSREGYEVASLLAGSGAATVGMMMTDEATDGGETGIQLQ